MTGRDQSSGLTSAMVAERVTRREVNDAARRVAGLQPPGFRGFAPGLTLPESTARL